MQLPSIITEQKDDANNFIFRVRAYRKLTQHEMKLAYAQWYQQRDKRRSYKNKTILVESIIGYDE